MMLRNECFLVVIFLLIQDIDGYMGGQNISELLSCRQFKRQRYAKVLCLSSFCL